MAITVKHSKVSTIPDEADTSLVRPSDWNADHTLTGTIDIANGGTGQTNANAAFNALVPSQTGNTGKYLTTNGTDTSWATNPLGTVTSVAATAGTGIAVTGSPITTSGTLNITNTAPDQIVVLNSGTGISTSGTYPNFTVTNTAPDQTVSIASGTGISATGTYPAFTVTNTAPDQVVALTGAGTTVVTGTYPNFTITSTDSTTGTVTSVAATAGTGISVTGSPITTSGTLNITNTAPDQTVVLTAGTGISTSGTYPNFTITNTSPSLGGDVVGPASSTDNAIARFDTTTGKLLQNSVVLVGDTGVVTGVTELTASTKVVSPHFDAQNSAGGQLRNASGTPQIQWGGGGGNNVSVDVAINLNPANSQVDLSPTGTGTVRINPATAGTMNNMVIGGTTPLAITGTTITATSFVGSGASLTNVVNSLTASTGISVSGSTGAVTVTNTAPDQTVAISSGTGISVTGTYPNFTVTNTAPDVPFTYTSTYIPFGQGTTTPNQSANLTFDGTSLTAPIQRASNGIVTNSKTIGTSFTIPATDNAMSSGPVTLSAGVTVTVSSGSRWVVL